MRRSNGSANRYNVQEVLGKIGFSASEGMLGIAFSGAEMATIDDIYDGVSRLRDRVGGLPPGGYKVDALRRCGIDVPVPLNGGSAMVDKADLHDYLDAAVRYLDATRRNCGNVGNGHLPDFQEFLGSQWEAESPHDDGFLLPGLTGREAEQPWKTMRLSDEQLEAAWKNYRSTRSDDYRNRLMEHYLRIVKENAERMKLKLPEEVERDDLISAGFDGLRDAIETFDPGRNVKFETYAGKRIRGAMLDALRQKDWVPRLVRAKASQCRHAQQRLQQFLGREPGDAEMAEYMGLSAAEYGKLSRDAHAVGVISLNRNFQDTDSIHEVRETDIVADRKAPNPWHSQHGKDLKRLITKALSKNERHLLILYYYEELTMKEIGAVLDLSESRVSQMHTAVMERLRHALADREDEFTLQPDHTQPDHDIRPGRWRYRTG